MMTALLRETLPLVLVLAACSGGGGTSSGGSTDGDGTAAAATVVAPDLLAQMWQVRMADNATRARFESDPGWARYFERDLPAALDQLGPGESLARARIHLEYAAFYRQALLMYAHSAHFVYSPEQRRQPTDPLEVDYLLGVSEYFRGAPELAQKALAALPEGADPIVRTRAALWAPLAAGAWPPAVDAAQFPAPLPPVAVGQRPALDGLPHYALAEQVDGAQVLSDSADPTVLYLLSRWHEQAALESAGAEHAALLGQLMAPWRLPVEPAPSYELVPTVDDAWLFGGFMSTPADLAFVAQASVDGTAAVDAWAAQSPLAAAIQGAVEGGKVSPEVLLDRAAALEAQVLAAMTAQSGGEALAFYRPFAMTARLGVLRAGAVVADASDQYRDAGLLRLNTLDASQGPLWDPVFVMSLAAWSAGNENTLRAQELAHQLLGRFPGVAAARYPLDALHIRRGRDSVQLSPVH